MRTFHLWVSERSSIEIVKIGLLAEEMIMYLDLCRLIVRDL